jgi:hypothetical protein
MKTFRKLMSEVAAPRSEDEKEFRDKHLVSIKKHPVANDAQHTGEIPGTTKSIKRHKRLADYKKGEDEIVYENLDLEDEDVLDRLDRSDRAEIKQKIYDEAKLDPVGQEDDDINNDGEVDDTDSYLHRRRRAISKAIKKEAVEDLDESTQKHLDKAMSIINAHITKPGQPPRHPSYHNAPEDIKAAAKNLAKNLSKTQREEVEQIDEISKNLLGKYATKALQRGEIASRMAKTDSDEMAQIANKRMGGVKKAIDKMAAKSGNRRLATSIKKDVDTAKTAGMARGTSSDDEGKAYYRARKNIGKMREETEQLDELSPNRLHAYIKKASTDLVGRAAAAGSGRNDPATKKYTKKLGKRLSGITSASGRLADRANSDMYEGALLESTKMAAIGVKLQKMASTEKNDMISNAMAKLGDHLESFGTPFGPKNMNDLVEKTGLSSSIIQMLIKKAGGVVKEDVGLNEASLLGPQGAIHKQASADQSDREYLKQMAFKNDWKKKNPGKKWPGYEKAGFNEEAEQIDEISASTLRSYIDKSRTDKKAAMKARADAEKNVKRYGMASDKKERDDATRRGVNRNQGISVANKKLGTYPVDKAKAKVMAREDVELDEISGYTKRTGKLVKEETDLTENFKTGSMKLNDGSSIIIKDQDAKLLNQLFKDLNSANRSKMLNVAMTDKNGFNEILGFAREAL